MTTTTTLDPQFGRRWVANMLATFDTHASGLGDLDRQAGDGDFGTNITSAFARARQGADRESPRTYPQWLTVVSRGFLGTGGTSGPLFGMFFRDLARCTTQDSPTVAELAHGLSAGLATVQRYGKAEVGHKTMVDALAPAAANLEAAIRDSDPTPLARAAAAATEGATSTADITARRGRASYVGEVARGVIDPGAVAIALIFLAARDAADGTEGPADISWANPT